MKTLAQNRKPLWNWVSFVPNMKVIYRTATSLCEWSQNILMSWTLNTLLLQVLVYYSYRSVQQAGCQRQKATEIRMQVYSKKFHIRNVSGLHPRGQGYRRKIKSYVARICFTAYYRKMCFVFFNLRANYWNSTQSTKKILRPSHQMKEIFGGKSIPEIN